MERWSGKVAIVTGASCGIGAAIAEKLVRAGLKVVGLARRNDAVANLAKKLSSCKGKLYAIKTDMTIEEDIIKAFQWVTKNLGPVHILINNAGLITKTNLVDGDTAAWKKVIDTNLLGLVIATREAFKSMKENGIDGHIVQVNSVLGHRVLYLQGSGLYSTSKCAITGYHESLRQELLLLGSKVKISSISPGMVKTHLLDSSSEDIQATMKEAKHLDPEDVANSIMHILDTPPHVQIYELIIKPIGEHF